MHIQHDLLARPPRDPQSGKSRAFGRDPNLKLCTDTPNREALAECLLSHPHDSASLLLAEVDTAPGVPATVLHVDAKDTAERIPQDGPLWLLAEPSEPLSPGPPQAQVVANTE